MIRGPERKAERSGGPFCSDGVKAAAESGRRPADCRRRYAQTPDGVPNETDRLVYPFLFLYNPGASDLHGSRKQSGDQRYTVLRK